MNLIVNIPIRRLNLVEEHIIQVGLSERPHTMMRVAASRLGVVIVQLRSIAAIARQLRKDSGYCTASKLDPLLLRDKNPSVQHQLRDESTQKLGIGNIDGWNLFGEQLEQCLFDSFLLQIRFAIGHFANPRSDSTESPRFRAPPDVARSKLGWHKLSLTAAR